jgi:hypothetical protein
MIDKRTASSLHLILTCLASRCEQVALGQEADEMIDRGALLV